MANQAQRPLFARASDKLYQRLRHRQAWSSATAEPVDSARGLDSLRGHKYALLTTYRKSGDAVPTPVWFGVGEDGNVYVRSESDVGKVKRIRNNGRARIAPSDFRGKPKGPPIEGRARILPPDDEDRAERAIAANYGRFRRMYEKAGERIGAETVYIEIAPTA
jgi:PPOX class probable F420-dependent enzyme